MKRFDYGFTAGCAFLLAASTAVVAAALFASSTGFVFIESIFIESDFIESAGTDELVADGAVVVAGAGAGAGAGVGAGAGAGAGTGAGAGGGTGSFLPQAASATTIIEASKSDLFILYEPFMVIR
ncbi:MAG: hypothetical protein ACXW13_07540 [Burkholderiaceae bacterium]